MQDHFQALSPYLTSLPVLAQPHPQNRKSPQRLPARFPSIWRSLNYSPRKAHSLLRNRTQDLQLACSRKLIPGTMWGGSRYLWCESLATASLRLTVTPEVFQIPKLTQFILTLPPLPNLGRKQFELIKMLISSRLGHLCCRQHAQTRRCCGAGRCYFHFCSQGKKVT